MEVTKIYRDTDCPNCGHPETILVVNLATGIEIKIECSKKDCTWENQLN